MTVPIFLTLPFQSHIALISSFTDPILCHNMVISIQTPCDFDTFSYSLAIIRGTTTSTHVHSHDSQTTNTHTFVKAVNGRFTLIHQLTPGDNLIILHEGSTYNDEKDKDKTILNLTYNPSNSLPYVRLVYLLTTDSDGSFQTPDITSPHDIHSGMARLYTAGLMIQSATAEMLYAAGHDRRTFRLFPEVVSHRLSIPTHEVFRLSGTELWMLVNKELKFLPNRSEVIDIAVMSFTRMENGIVRAHTALGGGQLALFGGGSLFCWPENIKGIQSSLLDIRMFDRKQYFDDSANRACKQGRRAVTSTTIGALLHELGHCLSLPHPYGDARKNGGGIMARGFDFLDWIFIQKENEGGDEGFMPFWDSGSGLRLRYHRYLQIKEDSLVKGMNEIEIGQIEPMGSPEPEIEDEDLFPRFEKTKEGKVVCRANNGIGHIGYYVNGENGGYENFEGKEPKEFWILEINELKKKCKANEDDKMMLSVIDCKGKIVDILYDDIEIRLEKE